MLNPIVDNFFNMLCQYIMCIMLILISTRNLTSYIKNHQDLNKKQMPYLYSFFQYSFHYSPLTSLKCALNSLSAFFVPSRSSAGGSSRMGFRTSLNRQTLQYYIKNIVNKVEPLERIFYYVA